MQLLARAQDRERAIAPGDRGASACRARACCTASRCRGSTRSASAGAGSRRSSPCCGAAPRRPRGWPGTARRSRAGPSGDRPGPSSGRWRRSGARRRASPRPVAKGSRLMSTRRAGVSTFSFIRSSRVVPPARNRTSAPCCAVFVCAATLIAAAASSGRMNSKVCMGSLLLAARRSADLLDRGHDVGIGPAAADVAAHQLLHVRVVGTAGLLEQRDRRHDLARRAVAALVAVAGHERRLHRVQRLGRAQALDRRDLLPVVHQGQAQARVHPAAVHVHGARAALPVVAALLRAGEGDGLAEAIEQRRPRVDAQPLLLAVDAQRDRDRALDARPARAAPAAPRSAAGCDAGAHPAMAAAAAEAPAVERNARRVRSGGRACESSGMEPLLRVSGW